MAVFRIALPQSIQVRFHVRRREDRAPHRAPRTHRRHRRGGAPPAGRVPGCYAPAQWRCPASPSRPPCRSGSMSVDAKPVRRIAHLARIAVTDAEVPHLQGELNAILDFVEQLGEVDVEGVEPMTSVTPMVMKKRADAVTDGGYPDKIVANAPMSEDNFFMVPKVVE